MDPDKPIINGKTDVNQLVSFKYKETHVDAAGTRTTWTLHPDNAGSLSFEREDGPSGTFNRHYLSVGSKAIGVLVTTGGVPAPAAGQTTPAEAGSVALAKVEYWLTDHLGSLVATADHTGAVTARYAYDPFGKRREPNGNYDANGKLIVDWNKTSKGTDRGFTGHEHLDDVGVVHMNGRLFDPRLGTFMQSDPFVQDPSNLQNFNRYGYCYNNPMTCTDPSGQLSLFGHRILPGLINNKNFKMFAIIAISAWTAGWAATAYEGYAAAAATPFTIGGSIAATSGFVAGSVGGFTGGVLTGGTLEAGVKGAVFGGVGGFASGYLGGYGAAGLMAGGAMNGYMQTGTLSGAVHGFAAGVLPDNLGFDAYKTNPVANIGIGILRDGIKGSIVEGSLSGFSEGVVYGQATNLMGHIVGFATTLKAPQFKDGVFNYTGQFWTTRGAMTFGNVISADPTFGSNLTDDIYLHENDHVNNPIERGLGALYAPLHGLDLIIGNSVRKLGGKCYEFIIEEYVQRYPYSKINPGFCQ